MVASNGSIVGASNANSVPGSAHGLASAVPRHAMPSLASPRLACLSRPALHCPGCLPVSPPNPANQEKFAADSKQLALSFGARSPTESSQAEGASQLWRSGTPRHPRHWAELVTSPVPWRITGGTANRPRPSMVKSMATGPARPLAHWPAGLAWLAGCSAQHGSGDEAMPSTLCLLAAALSLPPCSVLLLSLSLASPPKKRVPFRETQNLVRYVDVLCA